MVSHKCVFDWIKEAESDEKLKPTCPHCRKEITSFHPCVLIDSLIENLIKFRSEEQNKLQDRKKDYQVWNDGILAQKIAAEDQGMIIFYCFERLI